MRIKVVPMEPEHLDAVMAIENVSFPIPWKREAFLFEILLNETADYVVALYRDQVVGYGGMWLVLDEAHITNIAVHPDCRGRGIGRRILQELIKRAALRGATKMTLEVRPSNLIARKLYRDLGFEEKGVRKRYYQDNHEDAIIMWLEDLRARA
ncbi:[SSU ribosomal protein S18P]-alanine acetyltransferase [Thermodesulfitimonas autotrophica]|uniref:[Ribosomal protein bS18]-alanine N-acetyltransferase n=1 Tax=Thermodesulfitimonas autotrophica TaxID=1894989 RepID=A0A3N5AY16_9THEO|nr:ribosomal protein S18-alanine N-acetyltransferase [Thermodesulfitimonas autotrophica]RPF49803.1 [SSU ribosomal protein S18P]-alanine acetyltransferase [Thermodesulfitimonas autotrophica]